MDSLYALLKLIKLSQSKIISDQLSKKIITDTNIFSVKLLTGYFSGSE